MSEVLLATKPTKLHENKNNISCFFVCFVAMIISFHTNSSTASGMSFIRGVPPQVDQGKEMLDTETWHPTPTMNYRRACCSSGTTFYERRLGKSLDSYWIQCLLPSGHAVKPGVIAVTGSGFAFEFLDQLRNEKRKDKQGN